MRAVLMQSGRLWTDDVPDPLPEAGEALVKSLACGICGSDLHALKSTDEFIRTSQETGGAFKLTNDSPVVLGHEFCAEIVDYGPKTSKAWKPGTRVCSVPALPGLGGTVALGYSNDAPGGFAQLMRLSERLLIRVPEGLPTDHAALTEPMAVGLHAVRKAQLSGEEVPLVVGCGPVGLAVIAALKLARVGPVIAADFSPKRRQLALDMGADIVVDPGTDSPYSHWADVATVDERGRGLPLAERSRSSLKPAVFFECVGVPGVIEQLMLGAPREGRIVVVGVCLQTDHFRPLIGVNKELNLQFVLGYSVAEFEQTLTYIADGAIDVSPLVTGHTALAGVADAFDRLATPHSDAKIMVLPWESKGEG